MTLSKSIRLIRAISLVGLLVMGIGIYIIITTLGSLDGEIAGMSIMLLSFLILFFGRKFCVLAMLRRTRYPGLLWGVCDALGLLGGLDLADPVVMDDLYKPSSVTAEVLSDNGLSNKVYPTTPIGRKIGGYGYIVAGAAVYLGWQMNNQYTTYCYLLAAIAVVLATMFDTRKGKHADLSQPQMYEFTPEGLVNKGMLIPWSEIDSWKQQRGEPGKFYVTINTKGSFADPEVCKLPVIDMAITVTDVYILLLHYKYKYGESKL